MSDNIPTLCGASGDRSDDPASTGKADYHTDDDSVLLAFGEMGEKDKAAGTIEAETAQQRIKEFRQKAADLRSTTTFAGRIRTVICRHTEKEMEATG